MADKDKKSSEKPVPEIQEMKPKHPVDPALEEARRRYDEASKGWAKGRITIDLGKTPAERQQEREHGKEGESKKEEPKKEEVKPMKPSELTKPKSEETKAEKKTEGRGGK